MLRKLRNEKKGFTLIELMIVVAILGVLAAVAIPQYMNYVAASKRRTTLSNFDAATRLIIAEFKKSATGTADATTDVVKDLNQGNRKNPYWPKTRDAFLLGAATVEGDIGVSIVDLKTLAIGATTVVTGKYIDEVTNVIADVPGSGLALLKE